MPGGTPAHNGLENTCGRYEIPFLHKLSRGYQYAIDLRQEACSNSQKPVQRRGSEALNDAKEPLHALSSQLMKPRRVVAAVARRKPC